MAETQSIISALLDRFKTVGFRITATAGFLILLSVATGYVSLTTAGNYRQDAQLVSDLANRTINVFETDLVLYKLVRAEKDFVLTGSDKFKDERVAFSNDFDKRLRTLIESSISDESASRLKEIQSKKVNYDKNFQNAVAIFSAIGDAPAEDVKISATVQSALDESSRTLEQSIGELAAQGVKGGATRQDAFAQVKELSLINTDILLSAEEDLISV